MPPREKGAPDQIKPKHLGDYLEVMSKAVFQSGMSWDVVESKWPTTREAFHDFDMDKIAMMGEPDVEKLVQDTRVHGSESLAKHAWSICQLPFRPQAGHGELRIVGEGEYEAKTTASDSCASQPVQRQHRLTARPAYNLQVA